MNLREPDHLNLLCDMGELTAILTGESDIPTFLDRTVGLVAKHLKAHVCSIYLYEAPDLVLKATRGLNPGAVDSVRMKPGEGLVGKCFDTRTVIRAGNAAKSPGFKYFDQAGEDPFNSFLCMPVQRGVETIGVLVVQHRDLDHFTAFDERALKSAVAQVAGAIGNARTLMELTRGRSEAETSLPAFIRGETATGESAGGRVLMTDQNRKSLLYGDAPSRLKSTRSDFKEALARTTDELKSLQEAFAQRLPESAALIFTAHFMILKDRHFTGRMAALMDEGTPPVSAVRQVARQYIDLFAASPHAYMQEKAVDVEDLAVRILVHLTADAGEADSVSRGSIAVAQELYPSDVLKLAAAGINGIVLTGGGVASHVAILCRSLCIPVIIADDPRLLKLPEGTRLFLDTTLRNIHINPAPETLDLFAAQQKAGIRKQIPDPATHTRDGLKITLTANINLLSEVSLAKELNAEGIGLYRTEFPFFIRSEFPSEDEQYLIYTRLFDGMDGRSITVRTLDAGGEKALAYAGVPKEANPELGLRSIRFSLRYPDVFKTQIRAILRAAHGRERIRIMFPLISSVDEFLAARQILAGCAEELNREGILHHPAPAAGMMIELPSVLHTIDELADLADFFAIGTNDFIQYMLGADRANALVADHYIPHHPAVNRGLAAIARAAEAAGIPVSVCGEMARDPDYIPFLLGIGIHTLSIDPQFIYPVQQAIHALSSADCRTYAGRMLEQATVRDTAQVLKSRPGIR